MRQVKPQEVSQICNIRIQVLHMLSCNKGCILGKKYRQAQSHLDYGDDQTPISAGHVRQDRTKGLILYLIFLVIVLVLVLLQCLPSSSVQSYRINIAKAL
jgi:hypothetical protein